MNDSAVRLALVVALSLGLTAIGLGFRPLLPVDETRYLSVAWEMHVSGNWLVPHLNGEAYSHKPPLLFWLINLGWLIFGVSETWGRLVAPLAGIGCLLLTARLAHLLWPGRDGAEVAWLAPLMVASSAWWMLASTLTYFDTLMAFAALVGVIGLVHAARGRHWRGFALYGLGVGLGVLAKGPAILVHLLPIALLAPIWAGAVTWRRGRTTSWRWWRWYLGVFLGLALGALIALTWAIPAAATGGDAYAQAIFWGQTAGRMSESFAHRRPFWWYMPLLPALLFPWLLWPPAWRAVSAMRLGVEPPLRLGLLWAVGGLVIFSFISGKQPNYLLPLFAPFALCLARQVLRQRDRILPRDRLIPVLLALALALVLVAAPLLILVSPDLASRVDLPTRAIDVYFYTSVVVLAWAVVLLSARQRRGLAAVTLLVTLPASLFIPAHTLVMRAAYERFDLTPAARYLAQVELAGRPIAVAGDYHGEYHFLGRLAAPIAEIDWDRASDWFDRNPDGVVVTRNKELPPTGAAPLYSQPMRGRIMAIWDRSVLPSDTTPEPVTSAE